MKRITKNNIRIFFASFFITVFVIGLALSLIAVEYKTSTVGIEKIRTPLSIELSENDVVLTVNDKEFCLLPDYKKITADKYKLLPFAVLFMMF